MRGAFLGEGAGGVPKVSISYHRIYLEELIPKLRRFFEERSDVLLAIIFGSSLRRSLVRNLDIAVLLERRLDLMSLCKLIAKLEELTGVPVDLVPLDEAPPAIILKALQEGRIIFAKDKQIYPELLKRTIAETTDLKLKSRRPAY